MPERCVQFRFRVCSFFSLLMVLLPLGVGGAQTQVKVPSNVPPRIHPLPPLRAQAKIEQDWAYKRVTEVIPMLMREHGVDMWILSMREYEEDPVFWAIKAPTTFAARRRSIYVFFDPGPGNELERLALGGGSQGGIFEAYRSTRPSPRGDQAELVGDEQWRLLREVVEDRDPSVIAVNIDEHWAFADGLGAGEWEALQRALGQTFVSRVKRVPRLAVEFIAHRLPDMMEVYRDREETVHGIISHDHDRGRPVVAQAEGPGTGDDHVVPSFGGRAAGGRYPIGGPGGDPARRPPLDRFWNGGHEPPHRYPAFGIRSPAR